MMLQLALIVIALICGYATGKAAQRYDDNVPDNGIDFENEQTGQSGKILAIEEGKVIEKEKDYSVIEVKRGEKADYLNVPAMGELGEKVVIFYGVPNGKEVD